MSNAQEQTVFLRGNVKVEHNDVDGIHVQNTTTQKATITDAYGYFSIPVRLNDTLVFSAIQLQEKKFTITQTLLATKSIVVLMQEAENALDEVVVMPYNLSGDLSKDANNLKQDVVTSVSLGLPNAFMKKRTHEELQLEEADRGVMFIVTPIGFIINTHKLLNRISGRTAMLEKAVVNYDNDALIDELISYYPDDVLERDLKIPASDVHKFRYYCETDATFKTLMEEKDLLKIWNFLDDKSVTFLENNEVE
ncbi:carboxypeptidase-like regulatory domain-containing protein [Cellulophaga sp. HaHaR_3_176]|uniref:carboxypeptidase-like regulatory domain-containing protein n=1 Tax=Cellulophaga sp. HaHaR_3_176 TaxID=1942464 RepID=UPI001C1F352D|nr:carboxypeptidase-like regulatory domain-containing protein [Cellulophaga sp. HaHaR_3_176]QWX84297.1 carboxypeptidase-like regulatory domain-containing protein [Cellulophaga sp. HaHaR_3_176]